LLGRSVPTVDGRRIVFDQVWARREPVELVKGIAIALPCLDDLTATRDFAARPKDLEDLRLLAALGRRDGS
jgi:hypothetical protein